MLTNALWEAICAIMFATTLLEVFDAAVSRDIGSWRILPLALVRQLEVSVTSLLFRSLIIFVWERETTNEAKTK